MKKKSTRGVDPPGCGAKMPTLAEDLHAHGNACFAKEKYAAAIEAYSECICLEPRPVHFINRANCHLKRREYSDATSDCNSALALLSDGHTKERIKAQYFLGKAQSEQGDWDAGISALSTAHALCQQETVSFSGDIRAALLSARKRAWEAGAAERAAALQVLRDQMGSIGASLAPKQRAAVRAVGVCAVAAALDVEGLPAQRVPEHLTCQICYDIMLDPVVTPCGISYDRACLQVVPAHRAGLARLPARRLSLPVLAACRPLPTCPLQTSRRRLVPTWRRVPRCPPARHWQQVVTTKIAAARRRLTPPYPCPSSEAFGGEGAGAGVRPSLREAVADGADLAKSGLTGGGEPILGGATVGVPVHGALSGREYFESVYVYSLVVATAPTHANIYIYIIYI
eukprot:scaffold15413_cov101-Isochrysis_galbana.AAC.1